MGKPIFRVTTWLIRGSDRSSSLFRPDALSPAHRQPGLSSGRTRPPPMGPPPDINGQAVDLVGDWRIYSPGSGVAVDPGPGSPCLRIEPRVAPGLAYTRREPSAPSEDGTQERAPFGLFSRDLHPSELGRGRCASSCCSVPQRAERPAFTGGGDEPLRPYRAHALAGPPVSSRDCSRRLTWYPPSRLHCSISRLLDFSMANGSPGRFRPWSRLVTRACASDCIQNEDV